MEKKTIGTFIAALRKANGMTQQELADKLNISNKAVSRWERNECAPDISLIPAIAEIFGVTCDELLKGERIFTERDQERAEPKVEKQIKILINRSVSKFKTSILISLSLCAVGLVCMLGISYGFMRPIIGYAVMTLFEIAAFVITVSAVGKMKEIKNEAELFTENVDEDTLKKFNNVLGNFSYRAFFAIISVLCISLPLIICVDNYIDSVLAVSSYLNILLPIAIFLVYIFFVVKNRFSCWITDQAYCNDIDPVTQKMNVLQLIAFVIAVILFITAPYSQIIGFGSIDIFYIIGAAMVLVCIVIFLVFLVQKKGIRYSLILFGIRNILLCLNTLNISRACFVIETHHMPTTPNYTYIGPDVTVEWTMQIAFIIVTELLILLIFRIINTVIQRKIKQKES